MFLAPLWLAALLPWVGLVFWVMLGLNDRAGVPFLKLWDRNDPLARPRRALRRPPVAVLLVLLAALAAVIGAARPTIEIGNAVGTINVVVDRGAGRAALSEAARQFDERFASRTGIARISYVPFLPGESVRLDQVADLARRTVTTGRDTSADLAQALTERQQTQDPVVLLTDRAMDTSGRLLVLSPSKRVGNVVIEHVGINANEPARVLIRVYNRSILTSCKLVFRTATQTTERLITLPTPSSATDFIEVVPALREWLEVRLVVDDDDARDNVAYITRETSWPHVEARSAVSSMLQRMIAVYNRERPAGARAKRVAVVEGNTEPQAGEATVVVARPENAAASASGELVIDPGLPLGKDVDWETVVQGVKVAALPAGWRPAVSIGGQAIVAVREMPARQVWVGFEPTAWATRADFVVFFAAAFDWAGEESDRYGFSSNATPLDRTVWTRVTPAATDDDDEADTGIYRRRDGTLLALNRETTRHADSDRPRLPPETPDRTGFQAQLPLASYVSAVAGLLLAGALLLLLRR